MARTLLQRSFRFDAATLAAVEEQAKAVGITPSAYIRAAVIEKIGHPPGTATSHDAATELRALHNALSVLAARLDSPAPPAPSSSSPLTPPFWRRRSL